MSILDSPTDDVLLESPASFIIPGLRRACGDFESGISLTEFLARFNQTCDETNPASVYGALTKSAIDIGRALFLADLRDKDLMVKYVLNWETKTKLEQAPLFLIITKKNRVVLPKVHHRLNIINEDHIGLYYIIIGSDNHIAHLMWVIY